MLTDKQVTKFQNLYKKHFGNEIPRKEAYEQGLKLIRLVALVYKPITNNDHRVVRRWRKEKHDR